MLLMRPDAAHRVTVFGSTRNSAATSPGVRRRSLLPSTDLPSHLRFRSMSSVSRKHPFTSLFSPKMSHWCPLSASGLAERAGLRAQQRRLARRYRRLCMGSGGMCRPRRAGVARCATRDYRMCQALLSDPRDYREAADNGACSKYPVYAIPVSGVTDGAGALWNA
jgi:hypothetical protein